MDFGHAHLMGDVRRRDRNGGRTSDHHARARQPRPRRRPPRPLPGNDRLAVGAGDDEEDRLRRHLHDGACQHRHARRPFWRRRGARGSASNAHWQTDDRVYRRNRAVRRAGRHHPRLAAQPPLERQDPFPAGPRRQRLHPVRDVEAGGRRGDVHSGRPPVAGERDHRPRHRPRRLARAGRLRDRRHRSRGRARRRRTIRSRRRNTASIT